MRLRSVAFKRFGKLRYQRLVLAKASGNTVDEFGVLFPCDIDRR